ncbi:ribosome-associated translation inhibitor RaiA [uncultured Ellagibacter sp.]|uniref:ribosome hibernation-promoting factor, HPF/YfiA family n=1 Tax=uncultured Ellagibacter sp. TaxID=2137580 RepID=UPI0025D6AEFF|nr:ribosome-associated translation inhibitor RaiA [uncultured Ellagibacter sp.]
MSITVSGRKMPVTDALRAYAEEKIGNSMKVMDIDPLNAEVVLSKEKNPANPCPDTCEVTLRTKGHIIRVEEHEDDMYAAIDVAAAKVLRQLRKYKTRVIDRKTRNSEKTVDASPIPVSEGELDLDGLMSELSDDEVVRVKEIEFAPLTEEEALVQIDLLGHDFFAYTDRDTNLVNVLYRRDNGGYGLLKQKE